jgi:energy-coupling factor transporter ATP-binding protein EcfA2
MQLKEVRIEHYKAFDRFTLTLGSKAFLVGPNNAGKSTLISAMRAASEMIRHASRRRPTLYRSHEGRTVRAHELSPVAKTLVTENLRHQFRSAETSLRLKTDTDLILTAVWPQDEDEIPFFYLERRDGRLLSEPKSVREMVSEIGIVSGLYPVNQRERVLADDYVRMHYETRRSSQHARNHLLQLAATFDDKRDDFEEWNGFKDYLLRWLPELDDIEVTTRPGAEPWTHEIDVFIMEHGNRIPKELFWAGDGMQVFIQLLVHCWRLAGADVIVLDEPDLYLHADLQRRLVRLLQSTAGQTITATHSPEMLAEAAADTVVWVDKSRRRGVRRPPPATLEDLSAQIGSNFNLRLATALRARTVLFVEGQDMAVLRRLASTCSANAVAEERGCAVIGMEGFSKWVHVEPFQWLVEKFLEGAVRVFVLLDRDYRTDAQVGEIEQKLGAVGVTAHVWRRKELESYLLEPTAIARLAGLDETGVIERLSKITDAMTHEVTGEFLAHRQADERSTGRSASTILAAALADITRNAGDPEWRLHRYPPKKVISTLNRDLQTERLRTISPPALARAIKESELSPEMTDWLHDVDESLR